MNKKYIPSALILYWRGRAAARRCGCGAGNGTSLCVYAAATAETGVFPGGPLGGPDGGTGDRGAL